MCLLNDKGDRVNEGLSRPPLINLTVPWIHIRTTNPVESTFATVRLRTKKTKGAGSRVACLTMVFKLAMAAQKHWRALNGSQLIADVIDGVPFVDGVRKEAA